MDRVPPEHPEPMLRRSDKVLWAVTGAATLGYIYVLIWVNSDARGLALLGYFFGASLLTIAIWIVAIWRTLMRLIHWRFKRNADARTASFRADRARKP